MEVKAKLKYLRMAPRKVRQVADLIRGKKVSEAKNILDFSIRRAARPLRKLLDSAIANAKNNFQLDEETLWISTILVDEGPKLKRWRARARGRAAEIQKKTSHITLILEGEKGKGLERKEESKEEKLPKPREKAAEKKIKPKVPEIKKPEKEITPVKKESRFKKIFRRKAF